MALLGGPRFLYRLFKDRRIDFTLERAPTQRVPVLLAGAEDRAELFVRAMGRHDANYEVAGILSLTPGRVGRNIHGVHILGTLDQAAEVTERLARAGTKPQRLIVASERIEGARLKDLLVVAEGHGMTLARLPALTDFRPETGAEPEIRPIDVEDLLGRPQATLDRDAMRALIKGRRVLVTGAGGSIGAELVRQISDLGPACLALLDHSEYSLFTIDRELAGRHANLARRALIADIRDGARIRRIFADERPELVFHAAALKHVPLVEDNRIEGVTTNLLGTVNLADAAREAGTDAFVLISTDKAVNPTSVMGASKRMAETYCQALDVEGGAGKSTHFVTVRFGNVLGSTGSVVELFREQLARGGPLTVTHPEMTRYFMTTREAVELVLQASALGGKGEVGDGRIFVLDMGEPVRIVDLARQMIRLAGLTPDTDVKIDIIGPRPGEKLYEETLYGEETVVETACPGLLLAQPAAPGLAAVQAAVQEAREACRAADQTRLMEVLRRLVPDYHAADYGNAASSAAE
jgi:O-antigen biosynthesis protein WbqV